jgi:UDP:flavonoid glycosyltransferase YjiC (YdhE family)
MEIPILSSYKENAIRIQNNFREYDAPEMASILLKEIIDP